jgi:hypothetical protein
MEHGKKEHGKKEDEKRRDEKVGEEKSEEGKVSGEEQGGKKGLNGRAGDEKRGDEKMGKREVRDEKRGDERGRQEKGGDERGRQEKGGDVRSGQEKRANLRGGQEKGGDVRGGQEKRADVRGGQEKRRDGTDAESQKQSFPWHLQAGFFTSETLYGNLRVEAGVTPIHLIVSYGTDLSRHAWQFGLGSVISKNENRQWQIFATYSRLRASYYTDTFGISKMYVVKGSWYVAGGNYCTRLSDHWLLKAGASVNLLKTSYWLDGQLSNAVNLLPSAGNPDSRYRLLHPPYYLINTFDRNNPVNYKIWIGLSVGIYYSLPI